MLIFPKELAHKIEFDEEGELIVSTELTEEEQIKFEEFRDVCRQYDQDRYNTD